MKKVAGSLQARPRRSTASWRRSPCSPPTWTRPPAAQLARGARLVELLKQPQYSPYPVEEQVVSIWAGTTGKLDDVPVEDVRRFETRVPRLPAPQATTGMLDGDPRDRASCDDETIDRPRGRSSSFKDELRPTSATASARAGPERTSRDRAPLRRRSDEDREHGQGQARRMPYRHRPRPSEQEADAWERRCGSPPADPVGPVDQEDHPGDGAHRGVAHRQGAGSGSRRPRRTPGQLTRRCSAAGDVLRRRPPADHRAGERRAGRASC